jgi:hypothetical protein
MAAEITALEIKPAELAVLGAPRDVEYGLAFYRNQVVRSYERGEIPAEDHLVVAREGTRAKLEGKVPGRRVSYVGSYPARKLELFWVSNPGSGH